MAKVYPLVVMFMGLSGVLCITDEMKDLAATLHKTCVGETGVDEALIDKVNAEKAYPDDEKLKCYVKCILSETGLINDDGTIDEEATLAILQDDIKSKSEPIIRACGTKVGANVCETAWLTHKCYLENDPVNYILI